MLAAKEAILRQASLAGWDLMRREEEPMIESVSSAGCNLPNRCTR